MAKSLSQLKLSYEMLKLAFEESIDDREAFYDYLRKAESPGKSGVRKSGPTFEDEGQRR